MYRLNRLDRINGVKQAGTRESTGLCESAGLDRLEESPESTDWTDRSNRRCRRARTCESTGLNRLEESQEPKD